MTDSPEQTAEQRIVVGVDGSAQSKVALRWAAHQAEISGSTLQAQISWHFPTYGYSAPGFNFGGFDFAAAATETIEATLHEVLQDFPDVKVSIAVEEGFPAVNLLAAAHGAALLVVGSRGHGEFAGMLLGSVSEHCVRHAPCPVVVVPGHLPPA